MKQHLVAFWLSLFLVTTGKNYETTTFKDFQGEYGIYSNCIFPLGKSYMSYPHSKPKLLTFFMKTLFILFCASHFECWWQWVFFSRGRRQVACWVQKHLTETDMGKSPDFPGENLVKWIWEKEWNSSSYPNLLDFWILSTTKVWERVFLVMKCVLVNFWEKFLFNKHKYPLNPTIFLRPVFKFCIWLNSLAQECHTFFREAELIDAVIPTSWECHHTP